MNTGTTPLSLLLGEMIADEGPMTVARYMGLCLGHPQHGYYMTRDPFGAAGDFTTAPEISQMFGELIGLWAASVWQQMGAPDRLALVELGPGRGTLMADALRAARALPAFSAAIEVHLVEMSPVLRSVQQQTLDGASQPVRWHGSIDSLPDDRPLLVLANEFFDALPIHQFVCRNGQWHERLVGLDGAGALRFGLAEAPGVLAFPAGADGLVREVCPAAIAVISALAARLAARGGALLALDYGYAHPQAGDSLQALRQHRFVPVLAHPGEADLTAHVDFAALAGAGRQAGLSLHPLLTQGGFLDRLGIGARAARLAAGAPGRAGEIAAARQRLTGDGEAAMGRLFKVLCLSAGLAGAPPGFDTPDPSVARLSA